MVKKQTQALLKISSKGCWDQKPNPKCLRAKTQALLDNPSIGPVLFEAQSYMTLNQKFTSLMGPKNNKTKHEAAQDCWAAR